MLKTREVCDRIRREPSLGGVIPGFSFRSVPVPGIVSNIPVLEVLFYPINGNSGESKNILPPLFRLLIDKQDARLLALTASPLLLLKRHTRDTVLGQYPPIALRGKTVGAADSEYERCFEATDVLLASMLAGSDLRHGAEREQWLKLFREVVEPGLEQYYTLLPALVAGTRPSAGEGYMTVRKVENRPEECPSPDKKVEVLSSANVVPRFHIAASQLAKAVAGTRRLLKETGHSELLQGLESGLSEIGRSAFDVAVVGEITRGKTYFIKNLLGVDVLPEGIVPTTSLPTRICYAHTPKLWKVTPDNQRTELNASQENILAAMEEQKGIGAGILQVGLPVPWLEENGVRFIDTPGVDGLATERAQWVAQAIQRADATVLVVHASFPLSLTEKAFIEESMSVLPGQPIAIFVSHLDEVAPGDVQRVLKRIEASLSSLLPQAELWTEGVPDSGCSAVTEKNAILNRIEAWISSPSRTSLRHVQSCVVLSGVLESLAASLRAKQKAMLAEDELSAADVAKRREELEKAKIDWETLVGDLREREAATEEWVERILREQSDDMLESLSHDLRRYPDLKVWWEVEFPESLRVRFGRLRSSLLSGLRSRFEQDFTQLEAAMSRQFGEDVSKAVPGGVPDETLWQITPRASTKPDDIALLRRRSRVLSGCATAAGYWILGPMGAIASALTGVALEGVFSKRVEEQRADLQPHLAATVEDGVLQILQGVRQYIRAVYAGFESEVRRTCSSWVRVQEAALEPPSTPDGREPVDQALQEALGLIGSL